MLLKPPHSDPLSSAFPSCSAKMKAGPLTSSCSSLQPKTKHTSDFGHCFIYATCNLLPGDWDQCANGAQNVKGLRDLTWRSNTNAWRKVPLHAVHLPMQGTNMHNHLARGQPHRNKEARERVWAFMEEKENPFHQAAQMPQPMTKANEGSQ